MKKFLLPVLASVLLFACSKETEERKALTFELIETSSGKPISNGAIILVSKAGNDTIYTNEEGKANPIRNWKDEMYKAIPLGDSTQYLRSGGIDFNPLEQKWVTVRQDAIGSLKIHVQNISPCEIEDTLHVDGNWKFTTVIPSFNGDCSQVNNYIIIDSSATYKLSGDKYYKINWDIKNKGASKQYQDSIFVPAHKTVIYSIDY